MSTSDSSDMPVVERLFLERGGTRLATRRLWLKGDALPKVWPERIKVVTNQNIEVNDALWLRPVSTSSSWCPADKIEFAFGQGIRNRKTRASDGDRPSVREKVELNPSGVYRFVSLDQEKKFGIMQDGNPGTILETIGAHYKRIGIDAKDSIYLFVYRI